LNRHLSQRWESPASKRFRDWAYLVSRSETPLLVAEVEYHEDLEAETQSRALALSLGIRDDTVSALVLFPKVPT
jgi:hypothetical protein